MNDFSARPPRRILIASANPLFSKGLRKIFLDRWPSPTPEMHLAASMEDAFQSLESWAPDLVVVDYDDRAINREAFLNRFMTGNSPMQVMLVSLQESGEVVVYDRHTLTPDQARDLFRAGEIHAAGAQAAPPVSGLKQFFTPRWLLATLLVLALMALFVRLGLWQLDRLEQRRARNARLAERLALPALNLNEQVPLDDLSTLEYRSAEARGEFDYDHEIILRNKVLDSRLGVQVLTPLNITGTSYSILVDRGWIPFEQSDRAARAQFVQVGTVTVQGMIRNPEPRPPYAADQPTLAPGEVREAWMYLDLPAVRQQTGQQLLPVILQQSPDPTAPELPYRLVPEIDQSEGSHMGYAMQWFFFALVLAVGYPFLVRRRLAGKA